ncbi:methylated-DNA--[protein]-cysteine S-methyltransferase [Kineococcus sp. SYSU DK004]|uniref:methylated-DNA--[protein]-cysteine S-methyltransferase n=1 Tax=Kineococcus sp. SYSU DK004 TaxID=3383125 RepID=UPI003D7DEB02
MVADGAGAGGARYGVVPSPLGDLLVARGDDGVRGVWFPGHRGGPSADLLGVRDDAAVADVREQLTEYFAGRRRAFELPLAPAGDAFAQRVRAALLRVPHGATTTYGALARDLGGPGYAQAVGAANGRNPLSVLVPCHRVVGADGSLVGYAGGLARKRFLLALEEAPAEEAGRLF